MSGVFTIYDCGTAFDENSEDIIPALARNTNAPRGSGWIIMAGPGSKAAYWGIGDQILGTEMYPAKAICVYLVRRLKVKPLCINYVGWSRGAVTCLMTAAELNDIPSNMFLFDPVVGDPVLNRALHALANDNSVGSNVRELNVVQAYDASDFIFQAHNPFGGSGNRAKQTRMIQLPGQHGSSVYLSNPKYRCTFLIARGLVLDFLHRNGTPLKQYRKLTDRQYLEYYSELWLSVSDGFAYVPDEGIASNRGEATGSANSLVVRLFFNQHHIGLLNQFAPRMTLALLYVVTSRQRPPEMLIANAETELASFAGLPKTLQYLNRARTWLRIYNPTR